MVEPLVFRGVSARSIGDLLKGYGVMAIIGERWPDARFWWDEECHLVLEGTCSREDVIERLRSTLLGLAQTTNHYKPTRQKTCGKRLPCPDHGNDGRKGGANKCKHVLEASAKSPLTLSRAHDEFAPAMAALARAVALPRAEREDTQAHPWFPGHGREASGDYFQQIEKASKAAEKASEDLRWSLFGEGHQLKQTLGSGYLFFPDPMKRYATGVEKWVREKDAPVSPWCFLLGIRGALLFRGSIRRMRWGRRRYPAFPFVFEGAKETEVHLPTWTANHPRTLEEFQIQVRQFQARLGTGSFAATAAEFRAAVQGRGASVAFDTFHRFVLEARRPGQQRNQLQAIPRGRTSPRHGDDPNLRLMLTPLGESGWIDQFTARDRDRRARLREHRQVLDDAIHRAIDEATVESHIEILAALWELSQRLLRGSLRRAIEDEKRTPRPIPPLPARHWEHAIAERFEHSTAFRIARALASIQGERKNDGATVGPILEHLLPLRFDWSRRGWFLPDPEPSRAYWWAGLNPLREFGAMLWQRWLDAADLDRLPFQAARTARLADVVRLLRGDVDVAEVHRLVGMLALLDWRRATRYPNVPGGSGATEPRSPLPPSYAALRAWFDLGIHPASDDEGRIRDGKTVRLLALGGVRQVERAIEEAISRLAVRGLPWPEEPRPMGKAVARFHGEVPEAEAARMVLAVMIPISRSETLRLSRRLWVPHESPQEANEEEIA